MTLGIIFIPENVYIKFFNILIVLNIYNLFYNLFITK